MPGLKPAPVKKGFYYYAMRVIVGYGFGSCYIWMTAAGNFYMCLYIFAMAVLIPLDVMKMARDSTKDYDLIEKGIMLLLFYYTAPIIFLR